MMRRRLVARRLIQTALIVLAFRVALLFGFQVFGIFETYRFHVVSAALLFVACGLCARMALAPASRVEINDRAGGPSIIVWLILVGAAFALYWPALSVGFLSDDFVAASGDAS